MENVGITSEKLLKISKTSQKRERTLSTLDFVKSAASAGKISSEVTQIADLLLQHPFVVDDPVESSMTLMAVCIDLMFNAPLSFHVCKSIIELASIKVDTGI